MNTENLDGPDFKGHFTIRFVSNDCAEVSEAYASLNGQDVDQRPAT